MNHYLYKLIPPRPTFSADMTDSERAIMGQHVGYWQDLLARGRVVVFGPVNDPHGSWGLAVVAAKSEGDVRALGDADPAVSSELASYEIYAMPGAIVPASA